MKKLLYLLLLTPILLLSNSCIECHKGIEQIRNNSSKMMQEILKVANRAGAKGNDCVVCHGGNPNSDDKNLSHLGTLDYFKTHKGPKEFYPSPTSQWINSNTCGVCHAEQVKAQWNSLMNTEAGKIHGALWSFGKSDGYNHTESNYNSKNIHKRLGTKTYQEYMEKLSKKEPQAFPKESKKIPKAPTADEVEKDPLLSVYTYLRQECLRCHTGGKGRSRRGDFRGMGCASCHIPYSNEGFYEGNDTAIPHDKRGHILSHQIQSSRKVKVNIHGTHYSGVPVETCTTCHNRGKRIGVSYQGLMETEYQSTFDSEGNGQPKLHTKRYLHLTEDIHYSKGMLCQDCHTSNDMHGDGFMTGANLGAVEIECQDCHGTTKKYPWELPLGYSDEFALKPKEGKPRGIVKTLAEYLKKGAIPKDTGDGFLLSARGNPLTKAVRHGNKIMMHLASGKDIELTPLKRLKEDGNISKRGLVAMDKIEAHTNKLECYTCHATWAPQCYGCHVKIDYSKGKQNPDYLSASHAHDIHGNTGEKTLKDFLVDGKVTETRSYLRWEDPALSVNGEGRVSPTIPGCQTTITVIGKDGKALLQNHIVKIPNVEGAGIEGQNAITMSQVNPHTISKRSRTCESCHTSKKALGMGINGGKYFSDLSKTMIVDLMTADKKVLPKKVDEQIPTIANLKHDYSVMIDENGTQVQTVDNHWSLGNPLSAEQRSKLYREGACYSCHQSIPKGDLAISAMNHIANMAGIEIDKEEHNSILNKVLKISAWVQVGVPLLFIFGFTLWSIRRKRR
ncbi:Cytochrome c family protein [hydrothermal vent metagenome]|uniref:Cytochrome c family protein n=1 Tax=hydrothermal vent metagenome TaxID=652676 RepID=A0A1W1CCP1_9ZZZZ